LTSSYYTYTQTSSHRHRHTVIVCVNESCHMWISRHTDIVCHTDVIFDIVISDVIFDIVILYIYTDIVTQTSSVWQTSMFDIVCVKFYHKCQTSSHRRCQTSMSVTQTMSVWRCLCTYIIWRCQIWRLCDDVCVRLCDDVWHRL